MIAEQNEQCLDLAEDIAMMEPLVFSQGSRYRAELSDLVLELAEKASSLSGQLPARSTDFARDIGTIIELLLQ